MPNLRASLASSVSRRDTSTNRASAFLLMGLILVLPLWLAMLGRWANSSIHLDGLDTFSQLWDTSEPEHHQVGAVPAPGNSCSAAQAPAFAPQFEDISQALGDVIGQPVECAHSDPQSGDLVQLTSTGLAVRQAASGQVLFTDGYDYWAVDNGRVGTWQGP